MPTVQSGCLLRLNENMIRTRCKEAPILEIWAGAWACLPATEVLEGLLDDLFILDERQYPHPALAFGTCLGIHLVDFLDQPCPIFSSFLGRCIGFQDTGYPFIGF
jgi:hypothetical protein